MNAVEPCNICHLNEERDNIFQHFSTTLGFLNQFREHYDVLWEQYYQLREIASKNLSASTKSKKTLKFPLVRGSTRKREVIEYCKCQAETCRLASDKIDESAELLWQFLAMLVEQNGTCIRSDIVELLSQSMKDCRTRSVQCTPAADELRTRQKTPNEAHACTETLRSLLLESSAEDALQYARTNDMWGHAFLLAQALSESERTRLASHFLRTAIPDDDPIRTIYELMLSKQTTAVTSVAEGKSVDWRQHLTAIMSQACDEDVSRSAALKLGDALTSKGKSLAAHICYLAAGVELLPHEEGATNMHRAFESTSLPTNAAEVYKYARSLCQTCFTI